VEIEQIASVVPNLLALFHKHLDPHRVTDGRGERGPQPDDGPVGARHGFRDTDTKRPVPSVVYPLLHPLEIFRVIHGAIIQSTV
jgi:hypothetical protein